MCKFLKAILLSSTLVLISCSSSFTERTVSVSIPQHPWEEQTGKSLWYTLKWTNGDKIEKLYVDENTRDIVINIPLGETVFVTASPLGDMQPFGVGIAPNDEENHYVLNQNNGWLSQILMNQEADIRSRINFKKLSEICSNITDDFRLLDQITILTDTINGKLTEDSVKKAELVTIPSFKALPGVWISENSKDDLLVLEESDTPVMQLAPGVYRYYCQKQDREIRITVDSSDSIHAVLRQSLVP